MSAIPELDPMVKLADGPLAQAVGWALVQFVWQGALIGAGTALALAALRRSAADVRYVVASIALALMLTVPAVTVWQELARTAVTPDRSPFARPLRSEAFAEYSSEHGSPRDGSLVHAGTSIHTGSVAASDSAAVADDGFRSMAGSFVLAWAAGVLLLTLRLVAGWFEVRRLKRCGALPARDALARMAARLARRLHVSRPVRLLESSIVEVPTVIGWLKPVVLLPTSVLAGLSPNQIEAILAHELAHIRRHDCLVNLLQAVVETLLFYHPAVWWVSKRIRVERENCCDDVAVRLCGDAVVYARALADLEGLRSRVKTQAALTAAADGASLLARVRRLLGPSHATPGPGWSAGICCVVIVVTLAGVVAGAMDRGARAPEDVNVPLGERLGTDDRTATKAPAGGVEEVRRDAPAQEPQTLEHLRVAVRRLVRDMQRGTREFLLSLHQAFPQVPPPPPLPPEPPNAPELPIPAAPAAVPPPVRPPDPLMSATPPVPPLPSLAPPPPPAPPLPPDAALPPGPPLLGPVGVPSQPAPLPLPPTPPTPRAPTAPGPLPPRPAELPQRRESSSGNFVWSNDGEKIEVNYRGEFEFTDDDADVKRVSPGGWLRIRQQGGGAPSGGYSVEFRADDSGTIERRFWSGGSERPFDPEGRKWLARVLPRFIRQSGIGAEARVARLYKVGGAQAVLSEISLIEGGWAKRAYFNELFRRPGLDGRAVAQALAQAGREIDSDFELASLLISAGEGLTLDDAARKAYFDAAGSIDSDFELRRVLSSGLKRGTPDVRQLASVLENATSIGSDFECASLLAQVVAAHAIDDALRQPFFRALATVDSSFERGRVLQAVANRRDVSDSTILEVIRATGTMSNFDASQVLLSVASSRTLSGEVRDAYFDAAGRLGSFEQGRALSALIQADKRK